jgi:hypothetical protein
MFVLLYSLHLNLDFEMKIFGFAIAYGFVIFLDSQSKLFVELNMRILRPLTLITWHYATSMCIET